MRLRRLTLDQYGHFAGKTLDFGAAQDGVDLHVVYGPNEAGKSTIFAAIEDLFFGIKPKNPYAFATSQAALKVSAALTAPAGELTLSRVHDKKTPLLDHLGAPAPESVFGPALERLGRESYRAMFSLDEATLREGAKAIQDASSDYGVLLHGSSLGLASLSKAMDKVRKDAAELFALRSSKAELYVLKKQYEAKSQDLKALDRSASAHMRLRSAQSKAETASEEARTAESEARRELTRLQALRNGLTAYNAYCEASAKFEPLAALPPLPLGWGERASELQSADRAVREAVETSKRRIEGLDNDLKNIPDQSAVLELRTQIEMLIQGVDRRKREFESLPNREEDIQETTSDIIDLRRRLQAPEALADEALLLTAANEAQLRETANVCIAANNAEAAARKEFESAKQQTNDTALLENNIRAALTAAYDAAAKSNAPALAEASAADAAEVEGVLADALLSLHPWTGDADALTALPVPPPTTLERWRALRQAHLTETAELNAERASLRRETNALGDQSASRPILSGIDDASFSALLNRRDAAWEIHRGALDGETADAYHALAQEADRAASRRLENADHVAQAKAADQRKLQLKSGREDADKAEASLAKRRADLQSEVRDAAARIGLPGDTDAEALEHWIAQRAKALDARQAAKKHSAKKLKAEADVTALAASLAQAITATGDNPGAETPLPALLEHAKDLIETDKMARQAASALRTRTDALQQADEHSARSLKTWREAISDSWLEDRNLRPNDLSDFLVDLAKLPGLMKAREKLEGRIQNIEDNLAKDKAAARSVATVLELPDGQSASTDAITAQVQEILNIAKADAERRGGLVGQIADEKSALNTAINDLNAHEAGIAEIAGYFGVEGLNEALRCVRDAAEAQRLRDEMNRHEPTICRTSGETTLDAAMAVFEQRDEGALTAAVAMQEANVADLAAARQSADEAARDAARDVSELTGGADAAILAQERETLTQQMTAAAKEYLKLTIGILAAERAIATYQDKHQSGMLERASSAFSHVTRGSFSGLRADYKNGTVGLTALRPGKEAVPLIDASMSEGTRAQLYLALRIAAYHEYEGADPPPFIADDIMETFDDQRARETFIELDGMARLGQVIYLTHHAHLKPILQEAAPGARWHDLTAT